jgi:hypothetical protein
MRIKNVKSCNSLQAVKDNCLYLTLKIYSSKSTLHTVLVYKSKDVIIGYSVNALFNNNLILNFKLTAMIFF